VEAGELTPREREERGREDREDQAFRIPDRS